MFSSERPSAHALTTSIMNSFLLIFSEPPRIELNFANSVLLYDFNGANTDTSPGRNTSREKRTHRQAAIHLGKKEVIRENFDRIFQTYPCNAAAVEVEIFDCLSQTPQLLVKYDLSVILSFLLCSSASSRVFILMLNHLCYELLGENAWGSNWVRIAINKIIKKITSTYCICFTK